MTMMSDVPVFYDCEASCIGGLPIEIGWAFIDTSTGEIQSESHLVKPPLHWDMQPVWDPDAEKLHGISLEQLLAHGRPPFEVARRMNEILPSRELYSDGPADDERWLRIIFDEAGLDPTFTIRRTHADVLIAQLATKLGWDSASYEAAKAVADRISPRTHRAEADARHWAVLLRIISNGPAPRPYGALETGQEGLFEVARMGIAQTDSGPYAPVLSLVIRFALSILGGSFRYVRRWNRSLRSDELDALKSTFWGEADPDPEQGPWLTEVEIK